MRVTCKTLGQKKPLFEDWSVPIPPQKSLDPNDGNTLRVLITLIVQQQVIAFRKRQVDRQFLRALSADEITDAARKGKIEMGGSEIGLQEVDEQKAVHSALQAFIDGLYLVIIDHQEHKDLDAPLQLSDDSRITFLRLTLLSGA